MKIPTFADGEFVNATLLGNAFGDVQSEFAAFGTSLFTPGVTGQSAVSSSVTNLNLQVNLPAPFHVVFGNGRLVGAHGNVNGVDSSSYTLNLASLVPGSGSVQVYVLASAGTVGLDPVQVIGPPQGHPDYDPNFAPFTLYTSLTDTLVLTAGVTQADNISTFEICRFPLSAGQSVITGVDFSFQRRSGAVLSRTQEVVTADLAPTGVVPGSYTNPSLTVGADGRLTSVSLGPNTIPVGCIIPFGGPAAQMPIGYLACDGSAVSRVGQSTLFAVIGTSWGAGDGITTFNLPDLRGRSLFGLDNMGGTAANRITAAISGINGIALGAAGGNQSLQAHNHGLSDPGHVHGVSDPGHAHGVFDPGHAHNISDPGHAHAVADPGHVHAWADPGHTHGVGDPGHSHSIPMFNSAFGNSNVLGCSGTGGPNTHAQYNTDVSGTGIFIGGSFTGLQFFAALTGIGIFGAATGIAVNAALSGVQIFGAVTGISIGGSGTGITIAATGAGGSQNIPPAAIVNFIIQASGQNQPPANVAPYDIAAFFSGAPASGLTLYRLEMVRTVTLPLNLNGSVASCIVAPAGAVSLPIKKNGAVIGSINFALGSAIGTFIFAAQVVFSAGDFLEVDGPTPADALFTSPSWTISALRSS